ncbi:MAG: hypothetical protein JWO46_3073, partial [Nocardioidaceae bacterium]|nr:hypothetical protein [Nocardioidaceae bacterium]
AGVVVTDTKRAATTALTTVSTSVRKSPREPLDLDRDKDLGM